MYLYNKLYFLIIHLQLVARTQEKCEGKNKPVVNIAGQIYEHKDAVAVLKTPHFYTEPHFCKDVVVIQYYTSKLSDIDAVNPYRNLMVVDCTGWAKTCDKNFLKASIPFTRTDFSDIGQNKTFAAIVIAKEYLRPGIDFTILSKSLTVYAENHMYSIFINYAPWRNVVDKREKGFHHGPFHFSTPEYVTNFRAYSHLLPFTQTYLLQMLSLGSIKAHKRILTSDRSYSSSFVDNDWCTKNRRCNGGPFTGPHDYHFGEAVADQVSDAVTKWINHLFANVYFQSSHVWKNSEETKLLNTSSRVRFIVNEIDFYDNVYDRDGRKVQPYQYVGFICFCIQQAAHIYTDNNDIKSQASNEIPHELGHSYSLLDNEGGLDFASKKRSFSLNYFNNITLPYFLKGNYPKEMKTGAMNGAKPDETDYYFTSLSDYSIKKIKHIYYTKDAIHIPRIDPKIKFDGADGHYVTTVVCVIRATMDIEIVRINALIPSVAVPVNDDGNLLIIANDKAGNLINVVNYKIGADRDRVFALPQDFYPNDGYLHVTNKVSGMSRKYFIRNDALIFPNVLKGFVM